VARRLTLPRVGPPRPERLTRAHAILGALSVTEIVSWGVLYYAFAVFIAPMGDALSATDTELTGAFSLALLVSGATGIAVGRRLDRASPRPLMTLGSLAGVALVVGWSQVDSLLTLYAVWIGLGFVMATVLYEPAFVVIAKWFVEPVRRRRALTALTLVAALASFIFLPLSQALIDAHGWRDALLILAAVLGVITVPLHGLVLRRAPRSMQDAGRIESRTARDVLRTAPFWLLTGAFFLGTLAGTALVVHLVIFLVRDGGTPAFAAFAVGLIGLMQIPGRLLFATIAAHTPRRVATATIFLGIAAGVAVIVLVEGRAAVFAGVCLVGMGNGMVTLARATAIADLYGPGAYGLIGGVAASATTGARALGPVVGAAWAVVVGYSALMWSFVGLALLAAAMAYVGETRHAESWSPAS
jgi:predicted MFS family arabinose efflux permease